MRRVRRPGDASRIALEIMRTSERRCGSLERAFHVYNRGTCWNNPNGMGYARALMRTFSRVKNLRVSR